jgi:hypothetical protein
MSARQVRALVVVLGASMLACLFPADGRAQAVWGAISGYVADQSGAAVPGASVSITNAKTGVQTEGVTDSAGLYNITHLDPGEYSVTVEAAGFKRFVQEHVILQVDSTVRIDLKLELGAITPKVTVTGAPPILKSEKTDVAQEFNEHAVESLPTLGRNVTKLYELVPGVVELVFQAPSFENPSEQNGVSTNGQFYTTGEYALDGVSITSVGFSGFQAIVPDEDAVQEAKFTTADYDPEFGSSAGMIAQYVTKSGTNDLHGSLFWFNRNSATFAADPFTEKIPGTGPNGKGLGPAPFNENQGGFSLGAPIKKNKMFAFGDYQLMRRRLGATVAATVANDAFRRGDFSAFSATHPIFDPATGNPDGSGRRQFSCNGVLNVICPDRISPVATNILDLLPRANINQATDVNYVGGGKEQFDNNQFNLRYDWNISDRDKFFARYTFYNTFLFNPSIYGPKAGGPAVGGETPETAVTRTQSLALNFTHTFSPSLLTEFRGGYFRFVLTGFPADANFTTDSDVGIPNINTGDKLTGGLAGINIDGPVGSFFMGAQNGIGIPRLDRENGFQFINNWTKIAGGHQFRWGGDLRRFRFDFYSTNSPTRGNFAFCQTLSASKDVPGSGLGMATFLLGLPCAFNRAVFVIFPGERQTRTALYGQDIWRLTPKLTLNYGLRWDYLEPVVPRKPGGLVNWDPNSGDLILAGLGNVSKYADVKPRYDDFAPRVGFAYKLTANTVLRAGFGRSYFGSGYDGVFYHLTSAYPIASQQTISQANAFQSLFPLAQGPPASAPPQFPASGHLALPSGQLIKPREFNQKTEHVESWNVTLEHQLGQNLNISLSYVGNGGRNIYSQPNINAPVPGPGDFDSRRPYFLKFGEDNEFAYHCNCTTSNYNALEFVVEKRFSTGYSIHSAYTWAKALDKEAGGFGWGDQGINPYDLNGSYGISPYDRASVWVVGHTWQLPYGKGSRWGSKSTGLKRVLLSGWQFNGITTVEDGFAFSPVLGDSSTLNSNFGQRPDRIPGVSLIPAGGQDNSLWFNPAAFAAPPSCCRWGNAARGSMRGPNFVRADWSFWKETTFKTPLNRESTTLEFRWENFDFWNNADRGLPNNTVDSATAGRITSLAGLLAGTVGMRRMQFGLRLRW